MRFNYKLARDPAKRFEKLGRGRWDDRLRRRAGREVVRFRAWGRRFRERVRG